VIQDEFLDYYHELPINIDLETYAANAPSYGVPARLHALATDLAQGQTTIEEIAA
jgi:hypothetical protein